MCSGLGTMGSLIRETPLLRRQILQDLADRLRQRITAAHLDPGGPGQRFDLWEWRVSLEGSRDGILLDGLEADGGLRCERRVGLPGGLESWRFLVGENLGDGRQEVERSAVALAEEASRSPAGLPFRVWVRGRCWRRQGVEPQFRWEQGLRFSTERGEIRSQWVVGQPGEAPSPDEVDQRLRTAETEVSASRSGERFAHPLFSEPWSGPAVLLPPAAAWWSHEMGHAAIERPEARPRGGRLRIVDDPARACWPAGFEVDDLGQPAECFSLWDAGGSHRLPSRGHMRRASIRDDVGLALSSTRVEPGGEDPVAWKDLPAGSPVIASVDAGRLDPLTGCIALGVVVVGVWQGEEIAPVRVRSVLLIRDDEAWKGVHIVSSDRAVTFELATCTRQGLMHPVMVGAPTLALEPVLLYPREER